LKFIKKYSLRFYESKYSELLSYSISIPLLLFLCFYFIFFQSLEADMILNFYKSFSPTFLGASASIFGISLAALSVFISVIYKPAIPELIESNLLTIFLFPFLINICMWGIIGLLSFFTFFIDIADFIKNIVTFKSIFFTVYVYLIVTAFLYTISLANHVIKTTIISFSGEKNNHP